MFHKCIYSWWKESQIVLKSYFSYLKIYLPILYFPWSTHLILWVFVCFIQAIDIMDITWYKCYTGVSHTVMTKSYIWFAFISSPSSFYFPLPTLPVNLGSYGHQIIWFLFSNTGLENLKMFPASRKESMIFL